MTLVDKLIAEGWSNLSGREIAIALTAYDLGRIETAKELLAIAEETRKQFE